MRLRCRAGSLLGALALVVAPLPAGAAAATATATTQGELHVLLDAMSPAVATPGAVLEVRGRVHNAGAADVREVHVRLRLSTSTVQSRSDLERLASGRSVRDGRSVAGTEVQLGDLPRGARAGFAVRVPLDRLGLGATAVHPMAVEARGRVADGPSAEERRLGLARTQLAWASAPARVERTRVAWLWPLVDLPRRRPDGIFLDDDLAASLAPGGRLERLLGAVERRPGITYVIDPMLLDDISSMTAGYSVLAPAGSAVPSVPGGGSLAAAAWLGRLRLAVSAAPVVALPYGDPDVAALVRAGQRGLLDAARSRGTAVLTAVLGRPADVTAALPAGGWADAATAAVLSGPGRTPLVLTDAALAPVDTDYTPTGRATLPDATRVVLTDAVLSSLAEGSGEAVADQQRFAAETEALALERPGTVRAVAVAPPRRWDPTAARLAALLGTTGAAPWLAPATIPELLDVAAPDIRRARLAYPVAAREAELDPAAVRRAGGVTARVRTLTSVLGGDTRAEAVAEACRVAQLRLVSASLRGAPEAARTLQRAVDRALDGVLDGVAVLPADVQLPSLSGRFRVTVVNDTPYDVTVRVAFSTDQPRITVSGSRVVRVAAGSKDAVVVSARALARGAADVRAQLTSPDGTALGSPALVRIRVTEYGRAALAVTAGAAALLFLAATRNIVRRVRPPARRGRHAG